MEQDILYHESPGDVVETANWWKHRAGFVSLFAVFLFAAVFSVASLVWNNRFLFFFQLLTFLVLGIVTTRQLQNQAQRFGGGKMAVTMILSVLVIATVFWSGSYLGVTAGLLSVAATCSVFLLPYLLHEIWLMHLQFSADRAMVWQAPQNVQVNQLVIFIHGITVLFKVKLGAEQPEELIIRYNASRRMTLGDAFLDMVQKSTSNGQPSFDVMQPDGTPYSWFFFTTNLAGWNRNLNPRVTLPENGVTENTVIYACRFFAPLVPLTDTPHELNLPL